MATLTVGDLTPRLQYTASAGQTAFTYNFPIFQDSDLKVYVGSTLQTLTTNYTVSGAGTTGGGTVTFTSGRSAGDIVTIYRDMPVQRTTDYQANGDLLAENLNDDLDKLTMMVQQNEYNLGLTLRADQFDETADLTIPDKATRADSYLKFDTNGKPVTVTDAQLVAGLAGAVVGANYITNNATGDGTTVAFTLSTAPGAKGNLQIYIDGVYQNKNTFSLAGTTVTFTEAPPLNASVEFIIGYSIGSTSGDATGIDFTQQGTGAVTRTVANKLYESVSVKDFGAVGDGVTDDTAAFNAALQATATYSNSLRYKVFVPSGTYKLNGTIYVRLGQSLVGSGPGSTILDLTGQLSSTDPAIRTGYGLIGGSLVYDSGGHPVEISNMFLYGGSGIAPVISANAAGGYYHDLWFANSGVGISAEAPETMIYNNIFDQGANGIYVKSPTVTIDHNVFFNHTATGISLFTGATETIITNNTFEFTHTASIYFVESETDLGANITENRFFLNVQHASFLGFIYFRSTGSQASVKDCAFYNMKGAAISGDFGSNNFVDIENCLFDGLKTLPAWASSSTAYGVDCGDALNATITNCRMKDFYDYALKVRGTTAMTIRWNGGEFTNAGTIGSPFTGEAVNITNGNASTIVRLENISTPNNPLYVNTGSAKVLNYNLSSGTFDPELKLGGTAVTSYTQQDGFYTRHGNLVTVYGTLAVDVVGAGTGNVTIDLSDLSNFIPDYVPVNPSGGTAALMNSSCCIYGDNFASLTTESISSLIQGGTAAINLYKFASGSSTALTNSNIQSTTTIVFSATYPVVYN